MLEQALRHRLLKDAQGAQAKKRELRKTALGGLIRMFVDAGHAPGDLQQVLAILQGFRNFAAHPPQPEDAEDLDIDGPQASFLLNMAAELLDHVYVRPARVATMQLQLEQKKRGDAVKHGPEFQLSDTPRTSGPEKSLQDILSEDVPF